ncbi:MAG: M3 family metallopeptidase [Pseudomonadota bacterium]
MQQISLSGFLLPDFSQVALPDVATDMRAVINSMQQRFDAIAGQSNPTFESLVLPLEQLRHELYRCWSPYTNLNMVCFDADAQDDYVQTLSELTAFTTTMAQDARVFKAYKAIAETLPKDAGEDQRQLLAHGLRDFRLAGVALPAAAQSQFLEVMQALSAAQSTFASNVQRCTDAWHWDATEAKQVDGIPEDVLHAAKARAQDAQVDGWRFGLDQPTYQAVMNNAADVSTRRQFYEAWMTRASALGPHSDEFDNSQLIDEILGLRQQLAELLGFDTYADYSLEPKMAKSVDAVMSFLHDLAQRSRAAAEREFAELETLAARELDPWDVGYFAEQRRKHRFDISDEVLRPYFVADKAVAGLLGVAEDLYGLTLAPIDGVPVWHDSVQFMGLHDRNGELLGGFYMDLFARPGKRSGAWIDECVVRQTVAETHDLPVGYLVCNFSSPAQGPSLLTHSDIVTLFHEFGHMLHHLLTRVGYPSIAGINGVPWDAVELPSQFMENFAWHYDVLVGCSGHVETGEPLPRALFDRLYASRNASAGLQMLRQLEFALFDFSLHARRDAAQPGVLEQVLDDTRAMAAVYAVPDWVRFQNSFSHIFAGGYAAGYYSYKWAEVLAADAFAAFSEAETVLHQPTAQRFRTEILEVGGSRDIEAAFIAFRGRPATLDALLESSGINAQSGA